jgi:hypothetical protein
VTVSAVRTIWAALSATAWMAEVEFEVGSGIIKRIDVWLG